LANLRLLTPDHLNKLLLILPVIEHQVEDLANDLSIQLKHREQSSNISV